MIECQSCQAQNPAGSAFCEECGAALSQAELEQAAVVPAAQPEAPAAPTAQPASSIVQCPSCQAENPAVGAFCEECGAGLAAQAVEQAPAQAPEPEQSPTAPTAPPISVATTAPAKLVEAKSSHEFDLPLDRPQTLVGRRDPDGGIFPDVDLTDLGAEDAGVSRRHCIIHRVGNDLQVEDLGAVNHTYVNGVQLAENERRELRDGAELLLGAMKLTVRF